MGRRIFFLIGTFDIEGFQVMGEFLCMVGRGTGVRWGGGVGAGAQPDPAVTSLKGGKNRKFQGRFFGIVTSRLKKKCFRACFIPLYTFFTLFCNWVLGCFKGQRWCTNKMGGFQFQASPPASQLGRNLAMCTALGAIQSFLACFWQRLMASE